MKKLLLLILILLIFAACGNETSIHKDVDQDIAQDTMQSLAIVKEAIKEEKVIEDLPTKDVRVMSEYKETYKDYDTISDVDEQIVALGITAVSEYARSSLLQSEIESIKEDIEATEKMINTGEPRFDDF